MTPGSYVLAHSPLTGPAAWGKLPTLLREQGHGVVVINVQDDAEPPFAERYLMPASIQIGAAELAPHTILVAHSGAGPLRPLIMTPPLELIGLGTTGVRSPGLGATSSWTLASRDQGSRPAWTCYARKMAALRPSSSSHSVPAHAFRRGPLMILPTLFQPSPIESLSSSRCAHESGISSPSRCRHSTPGPTRRADIYGPPRRTTIGATRPFSAVGRSFVVILGTSLPSPVLRPHWMPCSS